MRKLVLVSLFWAGVSYAGEFALHTECMRPERGDCLIGMLEPESTVALLSGTLSKYCLAKTTSAFVYEDGPFHIHMTGLDPSACSRFPFALAYLNPTSQLSYERLTLRAVEDRKTVSNVDRATRAQAGAIETPDGEHRTELGPSTPVVYALPIAPDAFLVVYDNQLIPGDRTHVLFIAGSAKKIHGAAELVSAFFLNGRLLIHYQFSCHLGCGWQGDFVVEVRKDGFTVVFQDDSWST